MSIEQKPDFPSRGDLLRRLLVGGHLNPIAEAAVKNELGIVGQSGPEIPGELETDGAAIGRSEPVNSPKVLPNGSKQV